MKSFKEFTETNSLNQIKDNDILNEMARWIDVLRLDRDNILKSKITDDKFIRKINDLYLYQKDIGDHKIFKLADLDGVVLAYIQAKKYSKIDNRDTLIIEVSRRADELKGHMYGLKLYRYILENYCILSDSQNTPDSINVWISLFYDNDLENGIYDFKTKEVIARNIIIQPKDINKIWKKFDIGNIGLTNNNIPLSKADEYIGLYYRVFAYQKGLK